MTRSFRNLVAAATILTAFSFVPAQAGVAKMVFAEEFGATW